MPLARRASRDSSEQRSLLRRRALSAFWESQRLADTQGKEFLDHSEVYPQLESAEGLGSEVKPGLSKVLSGHWWVGRLRGEQPSGDGEVEIWSTEQI